MHSINVARISKARRLAAAIAVTAVVFLPAKPDATAGSSGLTNCSLDHAVASIRRHHTFPTGGPGTPDASSPKAVFPEPVELSIVRSDVFDMGSYTGPGECGMTSAVRIRIRLKARVGPPFILTNVTVRCGLYSDDAAAVAKVTRIAAANLAGSYIKLDELTFNFDFPTIRGGETGLSVPYSGLATLVPAHGTAEIVRANTAISSVPLNQILAVGEASGKPNVFGLKYRVVPDTANRQYQNARKRYLFPAGKDRIVVTVEALDAGFYGNLDADSAAKVSVLDADGNRSKQLSATFKSRPANGSEDSATFDYPYAPSGEATTQLFVPNADLGACVMRYNA